MRSEAKARTFILMKMFFIRVNMNHIHASISAIDEHHGLLPFVSLGDEAWDMDPLGYSWKRLQDVIRNLKQQNKIIELSKEMMVV